jgi:multidrug efflux pump subunit AcrA (membrane-fusion protein)
MKNSILSLMVLAVAMFHAACGTPPEPEAPVKSVPVEIITARAERVPMVFEAPGAVQARDRVVLSSQINGFVREVRVRAGDTVSAGQVLVTLDSRDADSQRAGAQAGIEEARAAQAEARNGVEAAESMRTAAKSSLDLATGTYARYQKLAETRSVTPQELDEVRSRRDGATADLAAREAMVAAARERLRQVEARIEQGNAQLRRADVYVGWSVVKAPAAGRVVERNVDPGSAIFPGVPLLAIESTSRPQVLASLPSTNAGQVRSGAEVRVRTPDGSGVQGRIAEIIPLSAPGSHTIQFKVDLPAGFSEVSGSYAVVEIPAGTRPALLLPNQAVRERGQLSGVFVVDGSGKARFRLVKSIPYDSERVELLAGIEPGERLIAKLTGRIVDGVSLEIR